VSRQRKPSRQVQVDEQIQVVLAVLRGELSLAEAARRHGVTSATVGNWRDRFVDAGRAGMDRSCRAQMVGSRRPSGGCAPSASS
jgi:transposase